MRAINVVTSATGGELSNIFKQSSREIQRDKSSEDCDYQCAAASAGRDSQQSGKSMRRLDNDSTGVRLQLPSEWA